MKNLSFVAAAFVAGLISFAPHAYSNPASVDKTTTASVLQAKPAKDTKKAKAPKKRSSFDAIIAKHAQKHGVPIALAHAVVTVESNYRANARGRAGEVGLMQIKPATARMMGYSGSVKGLYDPETNIRFGMKYLA